MILIAMIIECYMILITMIVDVDYDDYDDCDDYDDYEDYEDYEYYDDYDDLACPYFICNYQLN